MADIMIDVDVALTELPVNKVPLVASSDGVTIDETIAYNESGMDLNWNFITSAGSFTQTNVTPTTAGAHDWTHQGNGMYTIEVPASAGTINNDTEGYGWFSGVCDAVAPWVSPVYGFRAAALNDALMDGGDNLDVNTVQFLGSAVTLSAGNLPDVNVSEISDDATAATNLESYCDGTTPQPVNVTDVGGSTVSATGGVVDANMIQISADATAANNAELFFDGTGYAGGTTPLDVNIASIDTDAISAASLSAAGVAKIVADIMTEVVESEGSYTVQQVLSVVLAVLAGETSSGGNTIATPNGNATRVAATTNGSNERTAITITPSS
jgi:hypothetical protein